MNYEKGQSLIELMIAIGIFVVIISSVAFIILDSYVSGRLAKEITQANFLAEEGMEAVRSIRDNSWEDLETTVEGEEHGLVISEGHWVFEDTFEAKDVSSQLRGGTRTIKIEDIGSDRIKITSEVNWQFTETRPQQIQLISYLTNWQKITDYCQGICTPCSDISDKKICKSQDGCSWYARYKICTGACVLCENFLDQESCDAQLGCAWTGP